MWLNSEQLLYVIEALAHPAAHVINVKGEAVLTQREEQIVSLVAEGISNRDIAQQLNIKENTVKKCLLRVYDKLGVCNRVELVLYALSHRGSSSRAADSTVPAEAHAPLPRLATESREVMRCISSGEMSLLSSVS